MPLRLPYHHGLVRCTQRITRDQRVGFTNLGAAARRPSRASEVALGETWRDLPEPRLFGARCAGLVVLWAVIARDHAATPDEEWMMCESLLVSRTLLKTRLTVNSV